MFCSSPAELQTIVGFLRGAPLVKAIYTPCSTEGCDGPWPSGHTLAPAVPPLPPRQIRPAKPGRGEGDVLPGPPEKLAGAPNNPNEDSIILVDRRKQREIEVAFGYAPFSTSMPNIDDIEAMVAKLVADTADSAKSSPVPSSEGRASVPTVPEPARRPSRVGGIRKPKPRRVQFRLIDDPQTSSSLSPSPFSRVDLATVASPTTAATKPRSLLSSEIVKADSTGSKPRRAGLHLRIFLPNHSPFPVTVPVTATVEDVLQETLREHRKEDGTLPTYLSRCFELRLPDCDRVGYPDDDVPALDRNRKIKGFGDNEFCLCLISGALDRVDAEEATPTVRVLLPYPLQPSPYSHPLSPVLTARGLLQSLCDKFRLPTWPGYPPYCIRLSAADAARLKMPSPDLPPDMLIAALGVEQLELVKRAFSDVPPDSHPQPVANGRVAGARMLNVDSADTPTDDAIAIEKRSGDDASASTDGVPVPLSSVAASSQSSGHIYTIVTAARYEEWEVIKVNKRGRRQWRVMGIDFTRITNKKVEKKRFGSNETFRAERLIADVVRVEYWEHGREFFITYRESSVEDVVVEYSARSESDRAAIVGKLEFILGLEDRAKSVIRKTAGV